MNAQSPVPPSSSTPPRPAGAKPARRGLQAKAYVLIALVVILAVFVIQNSQEVEVKFIFTTTQTPLIFALLLAGVLGALIGWIIPRLRRGRKDS